MVWDENAWEKITLWLTPWWSRDEICDETGRRKITALSLTYCFHRNICCENLGSNYGTATHKLLVMRCDMMRLPSRKSLHCHSPPVGQEINVMRLQHWKSLHHISHTVYGMRLPSWKALHHHSQSVGYGTRCWDCPAQNSCTTTHILLTMSCDVMYYLV